MIERHVKRRACGEFVWPGIVKVKAVKKAATKARKGINPLTGQETTFAAKPARIVVRVKPLRGLKAMVES